MPIVFVTPDQVSTDSSLADIGPEHIQLAKFLFKPSVQESARKTSDDANLTSPPGPPLLSVAPTQMSQPPPQPSQLQNRVTFWSFGLVNRLTLVTLVVVVGVVCILCSHRSLPFWRTNRSPAALVGVVYTLVVLVLFALS